MAKKLNKRECKFSGCSNVFQKKSSLDMFCSPACGYNHKKELEAGKPKKTFKPKLGGLNNISQKKMGELSIYRPIRDRYLERHPICEVKDCDRPTTNLHHKMGRVGFADQKARDKGLKLLLDSRYFMACCSVCHPGRIHDNPEWARQLGYLLTKSVL